MSNEVAPEGFIFQCQACGKKSRDLYGFQALNYGYDESCVLNAKLVPWQEPDKTQEKDK